MLRIFGAYVEIVGINETYLFIAPTLDFLFLADVAVLCTVSF